MVPCTAQGWYSVFVNETKPASVLFRAYIRRKPSGLLLVTVLSTLLPRPLFRMYPAELGEAAAVERSVGHALEILSSNSVLNYLACQKHADHTDRGCKARRNDKFKNFPCAIHDHSLLPTVNIVTAEPLHRSLPCGPEDEHCYSDKCEEQHAAEGNGEFKQLGCDDEVEHGSPQEVHKGCDEKKSAAKHGCDDQKTASRIRSTWENNNSEPVKCFMQHCLPHGLHQTCTDAAVRSEEQACAEGYAVKQHLRLRVVWQGLLS